MKSGEAIGGYFGLELSAEPKSDEEAGFHTIRGALLALLSRLARENKRTTLWFPHFMCPSVDEVFESLHDRIVLRRYNIRPDLKPDVGELNEDDLFYSYNVFGLSEPETRSGAIVDNAHAFFSEPDPGQHALYSVRKFIGVPDGAYLRSKLSLTPEKPFCINDTTLFLLMRHDQGAEKGYGAYLCWEDQIFSGEVCGISNLSKAVLSTLDYSSIKARRISNFREIHSHLSHQNGLALQIDKARTRADFVPYSYPFLVENGKQLRQKLIENRVYSPTLWPGLESREGLTEFEKNLAVNTVHIPIDQRYQKSDMLKILEVLSKSLA
ncbi:hypothetical protein [Ruegeria atlantica]|uniref:hypothetical protein n=1 Tax=Ruegeria atlantica TaxID=81569 RepID=UPI00249587A3|nr:hypothetical protein [Ruegeria atlantica]